MSEEHILAELTYWTHTKESIQRFEMLTKATYGERKKAMDRVNKHIETCRQRLKEV